MTISPHYKLLQAYFKQQKELQLPELFFSSSLSDLLPEQETVSNQIGLAKIKTQSAATKADVSIGIPKGLQNKTASNSEPKKPLSLSGLDKLSKLTPAHKLTPSRVRKEPVVENVLTTKKKTAQTDSPKRKALRDLYFQGCMTCAWSEKPRKIIFGTGNADAQIIIVVPTPTSAEETAGMPIIGEAEKLLGDMLTAIKIDIKNHCFVTSLQKCRCDNENAPSPDSFSECNTMFQKQCDIVKPKAILVFDPSALSYFIESKEPFDKLREIKHTFRDIPLFATYGPSQLLTDTKLKRVAWKDLQRFQKEFSSLGIYESIS